MSIDEQIDDAVVTYLATVNGRWQKVAMVYVRVCEVLDGKLPEGQTGNEQFNQRLAALIRDGRIIFQGDVTFWRHSEVRLP